MKLYEGWLSSASWRVRWALALKKLSYQSVWLDIAAGEHLRVLPSINPLCTVPTLELSAGDVMTESVAIIEWLDETCPEARLLPSDARTRARIRQLVQLVNADIHPLQNTLVRRSIAADEPTQHAWCARWIERGLSAYEALVRTQQGRFSVGDSLTMADLFLVPQIENAGRFGADIRACDRIRGIYDACLATPEAQATQPRAAQAHAEAARGVWGI
jgi:maleylacetoacetate isomerase